MPVYIAVSPPAADLQSFIQDRFEGQEREIKALLTTVYESELDLVTAVDAVKAYVDFAGFEERLRRIEKRIGLIETTPSEVPVLPADQQPSLEEWDEDEIPAYLNDCAKWYHSTYAYFQALSELEEGEQISRTKLLSHIGEILGKDFGGRNLAGVLSGITMTTAKRNRESLDFKDRGHSPRRFWLNPKYAAIVRDYFENADEVEFQQFDTIEKVLEGKPDHLVITYRKLSSAILTLGSDVKETPRYSNLVTFKSNVAFAEVNFRSDHLLCVLKLSEIEDPHGVVEKREVADWNKWRLMVRVHSEDEVPAAMEIIRQAYLKTK